MKSREIFTDKIRLFKDNPRMLLYWGYKLANLFKRNALNNGERYDPNILGRFGINDQDQAARYAFAGSMIALTDRVLDLACGTGYGTLMLADNCSHIIGVDISKEAIDYAQRHYSKKPNIEFVRTDSFAYNVPADVVISFETIEHIKKDTKAILLKLIGLAQMRLICSVPYREPVGANSHHLHFELDENTFGLLAKEYKVRFLYQTKDGLMHDAATTQTVALIIVIDKIEA